MALTDKLTAIGDAIRESMGTTDLIPLEDMPAKVGEIYDAGKKAEYDTFWDSFQKKGTRTNYERGFIGHGFDVKNFYPKYDIRPEGNATRMFYAWGSGDGFINRGFNLKRRLEDCGVVLDTSKATVLSQLFSYCEFSKLPAIDVTSCGNGGSNCNSLFSSMSGHLITIEKLILNENIVPQTWFSSTTGLVNITIDGTLGQSGFNVSTCTDLSHDSLMSIINALKTFTDGTTKTVTLGADNLAKLTDAEKAIATQKGWSLA